MYQFFATSDPEPDLDLDHVTNVRLRLRIRQNRYPTGSGSATPIFRPLYDILFKKMLCHIGSVASCQLITQKGFPNTPRLWSKDTALLIIPVRDSL
jgi:hypothetical protein